MLEEEMSADENEEQMAGHSTNESSPHEQKRILGILDRIDREDLFRYSKQEL